MRARGLIAPVLTALLAASLAGPAVAAARDATPTAGIGELRVAARREVRIEGGSPVALSPDARWLAVWRDPRDGADAAVCAYDAATLAEVRCAATAAHSLDPSTAAWSPDGTRLAFTEFFSRFFVEPDVWVFD